MCVALGLKCRDTGDFKQKSRALVPWGDGRAHLRGCRTVQGELEHSQV